MKQAKYFLKTKSFLGTNKNILRNKIFSRNIRRLSFPKEGTYTFVTKLYLKNKIKKLSLRLKVRYVYTVQFLVCHANQRKSFNLSTYIVTKVDTIFGASDFFGLGEKIN